MSLSLLSPLPDWQKLLRDIQRENDRLHGELAQASSQLVEEQNKNRMTERGVSELRTVLTPLYQALQHIYGEIGEFGIIDNPPSSDPRKQAIWDSWKAKLPSGEGRAIDALLLHGTMTTAQLRIHVGCASRTAQNIVQALKSKGLIVKNGSQISLKEL